MSAAENTGAGAAAAPAPTPPAEILPPAPAPAPAPATKERRSPSAAAAAIPAVPAAPAPAPKVRVKVLAGHSVVHGSRFDSGFHKPGAKPGTIIELDAADAARLKKRGVVGPVNAAVKVQTAASSGLTLSATDGPKVQGPSF